MGYGDDLVLIVDDSPTIRTTLKNTLESAGIPFIEAEDGVQGLEFIRNNYNISMVISDVNMPNMDGLEMITKARSMGFSKPIIMLTTESAPDMVRKAAALKVAGWIIKPFVPEEMIGVVKKQLGRKG